MEASEQTKNQVNRRLFGLELKPSAARMTTRRKKNMADIANIVEELSKLTVIEAADLVKQLETKWGVSAAAPVAAAAAGGGAAAGAAPAAVAKDTFDVILASVPADKKIAVIKVVR